MVLHRVKIKRSRQNTNDGPGAERPKKSSKVRGEDWEGREKSPPKGTGLNGQGDANGPGEACEGWARDKPETGIRPVFLPCKSVRRSAKPQLRGEKEATSRYTSCPHEGRGDLTLANYQLQLRSA